MRPAAALLIAIVWPAGLRAQQEPTHDTPGYDAEIFAEFPGIDAELPFLPPLWPQRWPFPADGEQRGVCIDEPLASFEDVWRDRAPPDELLHDARLVLDAAGPNAPAISVLPRSRGDLEARMAPILRETPRVLSKTDPSMVFRFISLQQTPHDQPGTTLDVRRSWFLLFDPLPKVRQEAAPAPRGLVVLMPGLLGTPEGPLTGLATALRKDGWAVLRMAAQPTDFLRKWSGELDPRRPETFAVVAELLAQRTAECAYAVWGAVDHAAEQRPRLKEKPIVLVGFSGGGMTLPTVAARRPSAVSAAVIVGGGCHFWLMNQTSNYEWWINAFEPAWTSPPTPEEHDALNAAYLAANSLDSFHTAGVLRDIPTLMIQGSQDKAVPAPLGEVLWQRAGKPQRDLHDVGHEWLFAGLPKQFGRIRAWIGTHANNPP